MVEFYIKRILKGKMTIDQVPLRWREAVAAALENEDTTEE